MLSLNTNLSKRGKHRVVNWALLVSAHLFWLTCLLVLFDLRSYYYLEPTFFGLSFLIFFL